MAISAHQRLDDYASQRIVVASGNIVTVEVTPVLTVAATYAANDFVGTSATAMTFAGCARVNGGTGYILGATMIDKSAAAGVAGELWIFNAAPAGLPADSAAFTFTDAFTPLCVIPFSTWYGSALNCVSNGLPAFPTPFECTSLVDDLYGAFVTRGAPAYASLDIMFRLCILQD